MKTNVLEYLEESIRYAENKTAFADENTSLSFRELYRAARAIGSALIGKGLRKQPVTVFMKRRPQTIAAFLGVIYGSCYYVPMDEQMPRVRIEKILKTLDRGAIICDETTWDIALQISGDHTVFRYDELASVEIDDAALTEIRLHQIDTDPIYVVFTSGSTGVPKGVIGCHRSVIDYTENLSLALDFDTDTVFGNQSPLYFDACLKEVFPTLKFGGTTFLIPRQLFMFPVRLVEYLNRHKINTICWVASALQMISSLHTFEKIRPQYIRTVAFVSEVLPVSQLKIWQKALPDARFFNLYGPTEITGICCYYEVDRELGENESIPVGRPFRNTEILLLDENDRLPKTGQPGEICVRGTCLTCGYYRNPEKTAEAYVQNPLNSLYPEIIYRTGDIGRYNQQGELEFLTRRDNQIKHMGHRIELGEIEAAANRFPSTVSSCCVYDSVSRKIHLFYEGNSAREVMSACLRKQLPRYMIPNVIWQIEKMPMTPNGKIDRVALLKEAQDLKQMEVYKK